MRRYVVDYTIACVSVVIAILLIVFCVHPKADYIRDVNRNGDRIGYTPEPVVELSGGRVRRNKSNVDCLVVKYSWKNSTMHPKTVLVYSEELTQGEWKLYPEDIQEGLDLENADHFKTCDPGYSTVFEKAYRLANTEDDVIVTVRDSFGEVLSSRTYRISDLEAS